MSRIALLAVLVLAGVDAARGDTSLRLRGDAVGREFDIPASEARLTTMYDGAGGTLEVWADCPPGASACPFQRWMFRFGSRLGEPLVDGLYEGTQSGSRSADAPMLSAFELFPGSSCTMGGAGRFEIRGLVPGAAGNLYSATIDFETECDDGVLIGAIHVSSGDAACAGAPDGTACDDLDPCTAAEACASGRCVGERNPACDAFTCDDGDLCTTDQRVGPDCINLPVAGSCWVVGEGTLRATAHAAAFGRSATCRLGCRPRAGGVFVLFDDDTYLTEEGRLTSGCGDRVVTVPAESGRVTEDRRGRLVLTPDNLSEFEALLNRCASDPVVVKSYRTRLRVADDGATLSGVTKAQMRLRDRVPVDVRETHRFRAVRRELAASTAAPAGARARVLPECSAALRPKCVQD